MVTAKVKLTSKQEQGDQVALTFQPDYDDDRNAEWAAYTPSLSMSMNVRGAVADRFEQGKTYTLQFVED
ncbi:MAG: hypothetical protein M3443_06720 [Actinomycetota bacterium]|nr:hypothetical protein [Actinomycetota bacterium]